MSRDELARAVRRKRNVSTVKVSRLVIPLSSGYTVTVAGPEIGFDEALESCAEVVKEGRKAQAQMDVKTWARVQAEKAKRK
jgi:hypothetical protein